MALIELREEVSSAADENNFAVEVFRDLNKRVQQNIPSYYVGENMKGRMSKELNQKLQPQYLRV